MGGAGVASCVDPASLLPASSRVAEATTTAPTTSNSVTSSSSSTLFPAPQVAHCVLGLTWVQLRKLGPDAFAASASTGGLGKLLVVDEFEVWVCTTLSSCGGAGSAGGEGSAVCFTFSEVREVFLPWDYARELNFTQLLR